MRVDKKLNSMKSFFFFFLLFFIVLFYMPLHLYKWTNVVVCIYVFVCLQSNPGVKYALLFILNLIYIFIFYIEKLKKKHLCVSSWIGIPICFLFLFLDNPWCFNHTLRGSQIIDLLHGSQISYDLIIEMVTIYMI